jgi:signal transduction histidine kinase
MNLSLDLMEEAGKTQGNGPQVRRDILKASNAIHYVNRLIQAEEVQDSLSKNARELLNDLGLSSICSTTRPVVALKTLMTGLGFFGGSLSQDYAGQLNAMIVNDRSGRVKEIVNDLGGNQGALEMGRAQEQGPAAHIANLQKIAGTLAKFGNIGEMELLSRIRSIAGNSAHARILSSSLAMEQIVDEMIGRERSLSRRLASDRSRMIREFWITLVCGSVISLSISLFLALFLMKSITTRISHVVENTAKLVRREPLELPLKGSDEIAYLDRMLFQTGQKLVELETFKKELIAIVSHELRTPLLSISSALELFNEGILGEISEKGKHRLQMARQESDRLVRLINDLLDIEKMEAGKFILDISEINSSELVNQSVESVRSLAEQKQISIDMAGVQNLTLLADGQRLCQVLINLLSNAIKFSPENGSVQVETAETEDGQTIFAVIDHGRGIPSELQEKIFDRFVQVEETDATMRGGSGLGLAISKSIVEQHGGKIGVESVEGKGSKFWFKLPLMSMESKKHLAVH